MFTKDISLEKFYKGGKGHRKLIYFISFVLDLTTNTLHVEGIIFHHSTTEEVIARH